MSTDARIALQPAYLLHRKPYRDTSMLVEAFTRDYGRIGLVARGARSKRSSSQALLQPFQPLLLSWSGRGELQSLTSVEPDGAPLGLTGDAVLSGFYLNEILMRLLHRHDPHTDLYACYTNTLKQLGAGVHHEWVLRLFERDLLQELGYGLQLTHDADTDEPLEPAVQYCYHQELGPRRMAGGEHYCLAAHGETLLALSTGQDAGERCRREAKRLMRAILQPYLGSRPLASRELFKARYATARQHKPFSDDEE